MSTYSRFFCSCRSSTTGPISVPALSASSITRAFIRSTTAATNRSWIPSVTTSRLDAVHRWPAWKKAPFTATETAVARSEEHTSELQSRQYLVCRLLLEKKKKNKITPTPKKKKKKKQKTNKKKTKK